VEDSVVQSAIRRQRRSLEEKRRIVELTLQPGASVALIARQHAVNANQVFKWRALYRRGLLSEPPRIGNELLAVKVSDGSARQIHPANFPGTIHIELPKAYVRIDGRGDTRALGVVLEYLLRC
jgi:transposase